MKTFFVALTVLMLAIFLAWGGGRVVNDVVFERGAGGYLKRAADANTVPLAKQELATALEYLKKEKLTEGYTSVLWQTPDEDIGFWFKNLSVAYEELESVHENATQLEKSNVLIKLRETLLDRGSGGDAVTIPTGISIYPHNTLYFIWAVVSLMFALVFGFAAGMSKRY